LIYEASYGKESTITATSAVKFCEILVSLGRYEQAKELINQYYWVYELIM
jgi:hypothetical protein